MIDFACKKFDINEIIKCSLGLTKSELKILQFFIRGKRKATAEDVSQEMKLDLSTVQRALKKLHDKKVIIRRQKNLDNGGYVFCYSVSDKKEISDQIIKTVKTWSGRVEEELAKW